MFGDYYKSSYRTPRRQTGRGPVNGALNAFIKTVNPKLSYSKGDKLPNFKTVIATGGNATTRLEAASYTDALYSPNVVIREYLGFGSPTYYNNNNYCVLEDIDTKTPLLTSNRLSAVRAEALGRLQDYVRDRQTPFAAQVFLAESREVLRLLRNPLSAVQKLLYQLDRSRASKSAKALADIWLQTRFAIIPLLDDINSVIQVYRDNVSMVEKQKFYAETKQVTDTIGSQSNGDMFCRVKAHFEDSYQYSIRTGLIFERLDTHDGLVDYLKAATSDVSNAVLTAWEATPWSFLFDYFVNIDDIISASTLTRINLNYTSASEIRTLTIRNESDNFALFGQSTVYQGTLPQLAFYTSVKRSVTRDTLASIIPPLTFSLPSSGVKLANITALIISKLA